MVNRLKTYRNDRTREDKRTGGFKYKERDPKRMKERAEQRGGAFETIFVSGVDSWRPHDGDNNVRVLPPTFEDAEHYGFDVWVHSYVGADNSTYVCPKKMRGDRCPICEAANEAKAAGEDEDFDKLKVKKQTLVYILDRDGDDPLHPVVWAMSWTMDRDIAALCNNKKTGKILSLDHPDEGYDVYFKRTGKGLNTRYIGIQVDRDSSYIAKKKADQDDVLAEIAEKPLDTVLLIRDEDYLEKMIMGTASKKSSDEEEDDDRRGGKRRGRGDDDDDRSPRRRRGRDDDDSDDDDRGSSRSRRSRDPDEDDEDAPRSRRGRRDEGEDDDDAPRGKGRRGSREEEDPADDDADDAEQDSRSRRRNRDDDADERPKRRGRDEDEDPDEKPSRRSSRDADDDDAPRSRRSRSRDDDDEADEKPARRRR